MITVKKCASCGGFLGVRLLNFQAWRSWFSVSMGLCDTCYKKAVKQNEHRLKEISNIMAKFTRRT